MKSSEGQHFVGLDHIRALAVFIVFAYHFLQATHQGNHAGDLSLPINAFLVEGNTGVALFMTLSGYLFARLTRDRDIDFRAFLHNRALRLGPLLLLVLLAHFSAIVFYPPAEWGALTFILAPFAFFASGLIYPIWPNGAWSITTEFHFYLIFPALLLLMRRDIRLLLLVPVIGIAVRAAIYAASDGQQLHDAAYWTIIGRIDQFVLGMVAAHYADRMAGRHRLAAVVALGWMAVWYGFAASGGFYGTANKPIWIILTTLEGAAYGALIAWYDRSFTMPTKGFSQLAARIGEWSFSIYLLHFFFVDIIAQWIDAHVISLANFYVSIALAVPAFALAALIGRMSYTYIEKPFLRYRTPYFRRPNDDADAVSTRPLDVRAA